MKIKVNHHLTTGDLIKILTALDPEGKRTIVVAADEEGNSFGFLNYKHSFDFQNEQVVFYPIEQYIAD
jgi:hypothetical protein